MRTFSVYGAFGSMVHEMTAQEADELAQRLKAGEEIALDGIYVVGPSAYRMRANPDSVVEIRTNVSPSAQVSPPQRNEIARD